MNKKEKIKTIFTSLSPARKDKVRNLIGKKFGVSMDTVKNHWIYNGAIPEQHISEVLKIVKKEAQDHVDELIQTIDTI